MKLTLDHTRGLNLGRRGKHSRDRAVQDKLALGVNEEKAIELRRELVNGQERVVWNPSCSIPPKEFEFSAVKVARLKAALETWGLFATSVDRHWLQPLVEVRISA